ncbi:MAG: GLUG motif-containing protein, partial [Planctomycetota bacterium]
MRRLSQILGMSGAFYYVISRQSNVHDKEQSNRLTILLLVLLSTSFMVLPARAKYGGGTGTAQDPFLICDANHMNAIGAEPNDWDKCFKIVADIDLSGYEADEFNIIGTDEDYPFIGVFDGNNHAVSNFTCDTNSIKNTGLFGYVDGGVIRNLGLIDSEIAVSGTGNYIGSLVGNVRSGTIINCYLEHVNVIGDFMVGGLVGYNHRGTITNCYVTGSVMGNNHVGGLVGSHYSGTIANCYSTCSVTGDENTGGLIGSNSG